MAFCTDVGWDASVRMGDEHDISALVKKRQYDFVDRLHVVGVVDMERSGIGCREINGEDGIRESFKSVLDLGEAG